MSLRDRGTIQPTARLLLGVALIGTGACVEAEDLEASEADAIDFRVAADPLLPTLSTQTGPGPAYHGGVVTTTEPQAAAVGQAILAAHGNAVDAAVAVQFALNVYEPQSSGLGGGGFMLIHKAGAPPEDTIVIDFRDVAPDAATRTMFASSVSTDVKSTSGYAFGVPGTVKAMLYAKERYGTTMLLSDVMAPAINAARNGFNISSRLANDTGSSRLRLETSANSLNKGYYAEARGVFRPNGNSLPTGFRLTQPRLATTLEAIAARGANAFYSCADPSGIALAIVETQTATRSNNSGGRGRMTCNDLANYRLRVFDPDDAQPEVKHAPLVGTYHGYTIVTAPPPSSGVFLLQMLDMLEALETRLNFSFGTGNFEFGETGTLHIMQELMRSAFADRGRWLGDPDFVTIPTGGLLAASYIQSRSSNIQLNSRRSSVSAGTPPTVAPQVVEEDPVDPVKPGKGKKTNVHEGKDTTHFTVIDDEGTVVSVTSTISDTWGTGLMARNCGFMLNNQMLNFNDTPVGTTGNPAPNDVQPRKRPRTTITPTMVFLGDELIAAYGSPGGTGILNAVLQVTLNLIDHNRTLKNSVELPRISLDSGTSSADTEIEAGFPSSVRTSLQNMGYGLDNVTSIGAVQAIVTYPDTDASPEDPRQYGAADSRRIGGVRGLDER
ncbi:gamma-glutamyltransferase [Nannocystis radixulma]|uniref:Glutathione hydrolase proenzyme n=1 Tax=Nannocystis radixulma TaxID=2995305 RepID=A0ABT5B7R3_9BACT|nr:gamma-glutamyltransferase [Nannocystis radixulma]MDC0670153.1 gamma-glutamyltransferase [Nannocystis radixulma]